MSVVFINDDNTRNCEWTVVVEDSGSISVYKDGKLEKNSKDALRGIADYIGFNYDEGWNTRQFGSKLVDYMNEEAAKDAKKSSKADTSKSKNKKTDSTTKDNIDCSEISDAGDEEAAEEEFTLEKQFASMCLNVAWLDGEATPLEKRTFLELAERQPELNYEEVKTAFCMESLSPSDQDDIVYSVTNPVHQKILYFGCAYTAICDKRLSAAEQKYLSLIAKIWHLDKEFCRKVTDKLINAYSPVDIEEFVNNEWEDVYDRIGEVDGLSGYVVVKDEKFGFVDLSGNVRVSPRYERVCNIENYCIAGLLNGKWGFLNYFGEEVIPPKYDDYNYLINGLVSVKSGKKWGVINSDFDLIIPIEYERVGLIKCESKDDQKTGMLCCHKDEVMYIYDEQGKCISKFDYL